MNDTDKKLRTLKDLSIEYGDKFKTAVIWGDVQKMVLEWIEFLESEVAMEFITDYPQGRFQAKILRKIFNLEEWKE